jgi:hypothetical protein
MAAMASSFKEVKEGLHPMQSTVEQLSSWAVHEQEQRRDRLKEEPRIAQVLVPAPAGPSPLLRFLVPPKYDGNSSPVAFQAFETQALRHLRVMAGKNAIDGELAALLVRSWCSGAATALPFPPPMKFWVTSARIWSRPWTVASQELFCVQL